jgi:hypothetical protein
VGPAGNGQVSQEGRPLSPPDGQISVTVLAGGRTKEVYFEDCHSTFYSEIGRAGRLSVSDDQANDWEI